MYGCVGGWVGWLVELMCDQNIKLDTLFKHMILLIHIYDFNPI